MRMPCRFMMTTRWYSASRCTASRTGVRPMPSDSLSIASDQRLPGGSLRVTIISSSALKA